VFVTGKKTRKIFFNAGEIYCRRHVSGKFSEDIFVPTPDELTMAQTYAVNGANADFIGNPDRHSPIKIRIVLKLLKKTEQNPSSPQFSDVIAGEGNSGLPAAFKHFLSLKPVAKKSARKSPLKSKLKID
jgi:hypothetical protein